MSLCGWCHMCCTHSPDCYVRTGQIIKPFQPILGEELRKEAEKVVKRLKRKKKKDTK